MNITKDALYVVAFVAAVFLFALRFAHRARRPGRANALTLLAAALLTWYAAGGLLDHLLSVGVFDGQPVFHMAKAPDVWYIASVLVTLALVLLSLFGRLFVIPKFREGPRGTQAFLEWLFERFSSKRPPLPREELLLRRRRALRAALTCAVIAAVGTGCALVKIPLGATDARFLAESAGTNYGVLAALGVSAVLAIAGLAARVFLVPSLKDAPGGLQNAFETLVEYSNVSLKHGNRLDAGAPCLLITSVTLVALLAAAELFSLHPLLDALAVTGIALGAALVTVAIGVAGRVAAPRAAAEPKHAAAQSAVFGVYEAKPRRVSAKKKFSLTRAGVIAAAWVACGLLLVWLQRQTGWEGAQEISVHLFAKEFVLFQLFGWSFTATETIIATWIVIAVLSALALTFRIAVIPHFEEIPTGIQNALEAIIEYTNGFTRGKVGRLDDNLPAYVLSLGALLVTSAVFEAVGLHAPTLDLSFTLAMALISFALINYFAIKKKGLKGRWEHYVKPMPAIAPIKLIADLFVPMSMACRLFGNMLGGLIVMTMLYRALGNFSTGIAAAAGLFFNVFHPLVQAYIFLTLTLTFIEEAVE